MKASELMIGDWVQVPSECNRHKKIMSTFDMDSAPIYKPISVTREILESNGFKEKDDEFAYKTNAADGYIHIIITDCYDDEFTLKIVDYDKFNDCSKNIEFDKTFLKVHELQHALRLCGINKEIEL